MVSARLPAAAPREENVAVPVTGWLPSLPVIVKAVELACPEANLNAA
jgi:hypothetical protein